MVLKTRFVSSMRIALLLLGLLTLPVYAEFLSPTLNRGNATLQLNGIGTVRQLNLDYYYLALYVDETSSDPSTLLDARRKRVLHLRITADRIFASSSMRHFRELIHVNNDKEVLQREAVALNNFYQSFRFGLSRGDEIIFDNSDGKTTKVSVNGSVQTHIKSPQFFDLVLRSYLGIRPPTQQLKAELLSGMQTSTNALLTSANELLATEARVKQYQSEVKETAAPAIPAPVAEVPTPVQEKVDNKAVVDNLPTKPEPKEVTPSPVAQKFEPKHIEKIAAEKAPEKVPEKVLTKPPVVTSTQPSLSKESKVSVEKAPVKTEIKPEPVVAQKTSPMDLAVASKKPGTLSDTDVAESLATYQLNMQAKLQSQLEYPRRELKQKYGLTQLARAKGAVILNINVDKSGDINAISYVSRSGEVILDEAAINAVEAKAPFPPLNQLLPNDAYEIYVELMFEP